MSENIENDKIVEENSMIGVVEQLKDENMLAYYINGLYADEKHKKYKTPRELKKEPPILNITSSDGKEVEFYLTKNFSNLLLKSLEEVNKAHYGYRYVTNNKYNKQKIILFIVILSIILLINILR